ncbi:MAG: glycosyltransferase family 87 protein [Nitrosospira sp.]
MSTKLYYTAFTCLSLLLLWEVQDLVKFHALLPNGPRSDFSVYYFAAERVLSHPATLYEFEATLNFAGYTYPPLSILLFIPFTLFDYYTAYILFQFVSVIALIVAIWCIILARQHVSPELRIDHRKYTLFALLVLASGPAFSTSVSGQVNSVVLALCLGAVVFGMRRQPLVGGTMLAFACWIKIYPVLLVVAMLGIKSQRTTALFSIAAGVLLPVMMLFLVPLVLYDHYFLQLLPVMGGKIVSDLSNQSITASAIRLSLPIDLWTTWVQIDAPRWARLLNAAILVAILAMFSFTRISRSFDSLLVILLALAFIPLIAPLGWGHSYLFTVPLVAYCAIYCERPAIRLVAGVAWLLLLVPAYSILGPLQQFGTLVVGVLYFRYFLAAWAVISVAVVWAYSATENRTVPAARARAEE